MLVWLLAAVAAVVLYLVRRRPRTVQVTTLPFFLGLSQAFAESAWLRRLKRLLSLLLTLLVIVAAVLALGRLVVSPGDDELRLVVVLVDQSASMAARDGGVGGGEGGQVVAGRTTRLERGLAQVRGQLASLPESVAVSLIVYDRQARVILPPTLDRRSVLRELDALEPRPIAGDAQPALALAQQVAALAQPAVVWHVTDSAPAAARDDSEDAAPMAGADATPVELIAVGVSRDAVNVGITSFALRRVPMQPNRVEAFVRLEAAGAAGGPGNAREALVAELEVLIDDRLVALREVTLEPGKAATFPVPIEAGEGSILTLRVATPGDVLAWDDVVTCAIPQARPVRVVWVANEPGAFTQLALTTLGGAGELEVFRASPADWPVAQAADVVIFDGWQPEALPEDGRTGVVLINPQQSLGAVATRRLERPVVLERVRAVDSEHPVLLGVATGRLVLTQTAVLASEGQVRPVLSGPAGPVLSAGVVDGRRVVAMAFDPERSERLPLMASYPLLMGNALYWCAGAADHQADGSVRRTGDLVQTHGSPLTWLKGDRLSNEGPAQGAAGAQWAQLDRIGVWRVTREDGSIATGSAALLAESETRLSLADGDGDGDAEAGANDQPVLASRWAGEWTTWLIALALVALLAESVLFHRWAVW